MLCSLKWTFIILAICAMGVILFFSLEIGTNISSRITSTLEQDDFSNIDQVPTGGNVTCIPHKASKESLKVVKRIYKLDPKLTKCGMGQKDPDPPICRMDIQSGESNHTGKPSFKVKCFKICKEHSDKHKLHVLTVKSGQIKNVGSFQTITKLEKGVFEVIKENVKNNIHFLVLRCSSNKHNSETIRTQILPIDPRLTIRRSSTLRNKNLININILLSDSVSRAHFYRSLPKTIKLFKAWEKNRLSAPARIFDFELFQAVHGHTTENTHALFNGRLMPLGKTSNEQKVNPGTLFGSFQKAGYQTMWQEDLCWKAVWGLKLDLKAGSWDDLQQKLKENFIDHVGLTDSSCEVLEYVYNTKWPFYDPIQICYAGQFQHVYFFNYTLDTFKAIASDPQALPLVTYMSSSVGHDHTGRRIQSHDLTLLEYVKELSHLNDTITILLADHGNTYTRYTVDHLEGKFEMFHPHMFFIIPNKVADRLGNEALDALRVNQKRLVTIIELHHSIMAMRHPLTGRVHPVGLFTPISPKRTCSDFELRRPNLCVCQGWDTPVKNSDKKVAFVETAVGMLNDKLDLAIIKYWNNTFHPHSCIRLRAVSYSDVRERRDSRFLYTSMQIGIGSVDLKAAEKFHVEVESRLVPFQNSLDIKLKNFDRLSLYGVYKACADNGALLKLCSCAKGAKKKKDSSDKLNITDLMAPLGREYLGKETISQLKGDSLGCLYLLSRSHNFVSYAYELANICPDKVYRVEVNVGSKVIKLSRSCPFQITVNAGIRFLLSATKNSFTRKHNGIEIGIKVLEKQSALFTKN